MKKIEWKKHNFFKSFVYAFEGMIYSFSTQPNAVVEVCIGIFAVTCGFIFKISNIEWLVLCLTIASVLCLEILNTAVEEAVDLITSQKNEKAKHAKDCAAGAVLFASINSVIVGLIIFLPKFIALF